MLDNANIRKDFPMLQKTMQSHPLVYLDSGATTLKPRQVIDAVVNYYENYGANAHRGDYDLSYFVDQEYEQTRKDVAAFLHAADAREIVYTSGASSALNLVWRSMLRVCCRGCVLHRNAELLFSMCRWMRRDASPWRQLLP